MLMVTTTVGETAHVDVLGGRLVLNGQVLIEIGAEPDPISVGRALGCHVVLQDRKVSALHLELTPTVRGLHVRDLSRNGTLIDKHRCGEQWLLGYAKIQCGETVLEFFPAPRTAQIKKGANVPIDPLVGTAPEMGRLYDRIRKVAPMDLSVLITGETGTGKELVARAIHLTSQRAGKLFGIIDCGAIAPSLAESALFGHKRGAFTGAHDERLSPFLEVDGGTIFLDEIGELPAEVQKKLLRVLEDRRVQAVGSNTYRPFNVRVVAATRRDLNVRDDDDEVSTKRTFRSDLFFRIAQVRLVTPALRDRTSDIPLLIEHFGRDFPNVMKRISPESLDRLMRYDWPGNVRELRNVATAAIGFAGDDEAIDFEQHLQGDANVGQIETFAVLERRYLEKVHRQCGGNQSAMSRVSGIPRNTLRDKMKRLEIPS
jgi:DNA-binding NtrC family response regulator